MIHFTEEEMLLLAVDAAETRLESLAYFREVQPLADEPEMQGLIGGVISKLQMLSDEEYRQLDFAVYDVWIEDIKAEDAEQEDYKDSLAKGGAMK